MKVRAVGYVGAESPEAKQWEEFGPEVLGLQRVDGDVPDTVYLRMDDRHHRLAVHPGPKDRLAYLGWELAGDDDLAEAADDLARAGYTVTEATEEECEERAVRRFVSVLDPGGARHEFFYGQLSLPGQFQPGRPLSGFVTGEQGMGHVVCVVPDLAAATRFYKMCGFKKSDEIYAFIDAHFFHCNPRHHSLALTEACNANAKCTKASKGIAATVQIDGADSPEAGGFTMEGGAGTVHVITGHRGGADVNLELDYPTMVELSKGTINGPLAVATGRMKAAGNMEKMFNLGKAMDLLPVIEAGIGLDY